jgi:hypothetical protein
MTRATLIRSAGAALLLAGIAAVTLYQFGGTAAAGEVTVWKSPACGCCGKWVEHLRANGFSVVVRETNDLAPVKRAHGVPAALESCHTAEVDGYTIEGHVPAAEVKRLLAEKPQARGLAVAGMPAGSPGMEQGGAREAYDVILFDDQKKQSVFRRY